MNRRGCPAPEGWLGDRTAGSPGRALARKRNDHAGSGGEVYRLSVCLSRNTGGPETFCSCQHGGDLLVLVILLTETSLSFAQGHRDTPQEQQACKRDAQRFCRQQLGDDGAVNVAYTRPGCARAAKKYCQPRYVRLPDGSLRQPPGTMRLSRRNRRGFRFLDEHILRALPLASSLRKSVRYGPAEHTIASRSSSARLKPNTANRHTGAVASTASKAKVSHASGAGKVIGQLSAPCVLRRTFRSLVVRAPAESIRR